MSSPIELSGIAWDHSRAYPPLIATAQRYEETHPGVRIRWEKRSLDQFGHMPIDQLAHRFDLVVIDHPWAGFAFEKELLRDLKPLLSPAALNGYARDFIGAAFASYEYEGQLLALPIDAATPAPSWRPDLMERANAVVPTTWADGIALARRKMAVIPAFNADLFLHFLMLAKALAPKAGEDPEQLAPREAARAALDLLRELTEPMPRAIFDWNPIQVAERMAATDDFAWCPFAYTYNNYARAGFARNRLRYGNLMSLQPRGSRLRSVLGGTGLALSANCRHAEIALDYACFVADGTTQRALYLTAGGQPAHRAAWNDALGDYLCGGFFTGTRSTQEEAFIRPRYCGYVPLQTHGGNALQEILRDGADAERALDKLDALHRESRRAADQPVFA